MKFLVDELPVYPSGCPFCEWFDICKLDGKRCNKDDDRGECDWLKVVKIHE